MSQIYNDNIRDQQIGILKKFIHFAGKFSRGPQVQETALLG